MTKLVANAAPDDKSANVMQARGTLLPYREWLVWREMQAHIVAKWAKLFEDIDVLLCPVTPTPAMPHMQHKPIGEREIMVNGKLRPYLDNIV